MTASRAVILLLASLLAACASWRWSGSPTDTGRPATGSLLYVENHAQQRSAPRQDPGQDDLTAMQVSTTPAPGR